MQLILGHHTLDLSRPRVMGILNVTPDSFSDGGVYCNTERAVQHARDMVAAGADIIDVGGESTRPGSRAVPFNEEIERVVPVVERLAETGVLVSVDTGKPEVMRAAVAAGASMVNDVYALGQPGALPAAAGLDAAICLMHMLGTPATMQEEPRYRALPDDVIGYLAGRVAACEAAGIDRGRILLDPGFGFGKTDQHNLVLLRELAAFASLDLPLLVGLSRKRTLGRVTGRATNDRVAAGVAVAVLAVERGAHIVRTHDVAATVDALAMVVAMRNADFCDAAAMGSSATVQKRKSG